MYHDAGEPDATELYEQMVRPYREPRRYPPKFRKLPKPVSEREPAHKPTRAQRRILEALTRPYARIMVGSYGYLVTDGRGWMDDRASRALTTDELNALGRAGWILSRKGYGNRTEYVLTLAGREAVQPQ